MKTRYIKTLILSLSFVIVMLSVTAQESNTLQFMKGLPQSELSNPALHNDSSSMILGLPFLSGISFDLSTDFSVNDLFHYGTGAQKDSLVMDINSFYNTLREGKNTINEAVSINLFYLRFRTKNTFFSINIKEKQFAQFSFDKNLINFIKEGNAAFMGQNYDLGTIGINAVHYREVGFGVSHDYLDNRLSVGVKLKALFGKFAIQTNKLNLKVETAADGSTINIESDIQVDVSAPIELDYDENDYVSEVNDNLSSYEYIFNTENVGIALDLGAVYKLNDKINLAASVVDLGSIPFKTNVFNINHKASYEWDGLDFTNSINENDENYVDPDDLTDQDVEEIEAVFKPKRSEVTEKEFSLAIPTKIYLGGTYKYSPNLDFAVLDRIYMYDGVTRNSFTLSANALLAKFVSLTGSYSIIGDSYTNLGLGVGIRAGFMQFYFVNDNVLAFNNPAKSEFVNFRFGMNLLFGRRYKQFLD